MRIIYYIFTIALLSSINCFSANTLMEVSFLRNNSTIVLPQESSDLSSTENSPILADVDANPLGGVKRRRDLVDPEAPAPREGRRRITPTLIAGPAAPAPQAPAPREGRRRITPVLVAGPAAPRGAFAATMDIPTPPLSAIAPTVLSSESEPEPSEYSSSSESSESEPEPSEYSSSSESSESEPESSEYSNSSDEYDLSQPSDASDASPQSKQHAYGARANSSAQPQRLQAAEYFFSPHNHTKATPNKHLFPSR